MTDTYTKFRNEVMAGGADNPDLEPTAGGPTAFIGLGVIAVLLVALYMWSPWAFVFVIGLLISIFLHELGHFSTARWTGMKATQFFLFMGPKLWSFRRGETEYGIRAYPVGAFVRIIGMNNLDEVAPEDEPRAYRNKSYPRRMLVITAGSIMHILIAIALIFGVYAVNGRRVETGRVGIGSCRRRPACSAGRGRSGRHHRVDQWSRAHHPRRVRQRDSRSRPGRHGRAGHRSRWPDADQGRRARCQPESGRRVRQGLPGRVVRQRGHVEQRGSARRRHETACSTSGPPCGRASVAW